MIATLNKISADHNCCEDSILVIENQNFIYGGVFDGCSTGNKSHWASQTFAYAFAKYDLPTTDDTLHDVRDLLDLVMIHMDIHFTSMLSTCVLFSYHKASRTLRVRVFGDGSYFVNGTRYTVNQNNIPDYFGYHILDDLSQFNEFLAKYPEQVYHDVIQFQICSDGIENISRSAFAPPTDRDPLKLLLAFPTSSNYLDRQWNILKRDHFTLSDDLSIISYVKD